MKLTEGHAQWPNGYCARHRDKLRLLNPGQVHCVVLLVWARNCTIAVPLSPLGPDHCKGMQPITNSEGGGKQGRGGYLPWTSIPSHPILVTVSSDASNRFMLQLLSPGLQLSSSLYDTLAKWRSPFKCQCRPHRTAEVTICVESSVQFALLVKNPKMKRGSVKSQTSN